MILNLTIPLPGTLNMSALGSYSFAVTATAVGDLNLTNNVLTPAPTRTVAAPIAGTLTASTARCAPAPFRLEGALYGPEPRRWVAESTRSSCPTPGLHMRHRMGNTIM